MRMTGRLLTTAALAAVMAAGLVNASIAQDATPMAGEAPPTGYPNHFHEGTCDDLAAEPAIPLAPLQFPDWVASLSGEETDVEAVLPDPDDFGNAPIPVSVSTTEVQTALTDLLAGHYVINVHDAADPSVYIACGNVGGVADERGDLFFGLDEQEGSGYTGAVWLHDNGGSTTVVVVLTHPAAQPDIETGLAALVAAAAEEEAAATPTAPPAATPEPAAEATPITT